MSIEVGKQTKTTETPVKDLVLYNKQNIIDGLGGNNSIEKTIESLESIKSSQDPDTQKSIENTISMLKETETESEKTFDSANRSFTSIKKNRKDTTSYCPKFTKNGEVESFDESKFSDIKDTNEYMITAMGNSILIDKGDYRVVDKIFEVELSKAPNKKEELYALIKEVHNMGELFEDNAFKQGKKVQRLKNGLIKLFDMTDEDAQAKAFNLTDNGVAGIIGDIIKYAAGFHHHKVSKFAGTTLGLLVAYKFGIEDPSLLGLAGVGFAGRKGYELLGGEAINKLFKKKESQTTNENNEGSEDTEEILIMSAAQLDNYMRTTLKINSIDKVDDKITNKTQAKDQIDTSAIEQSITNTEASIRITEADIESANDSLSTAQRQDTSRYQVLLNQHNRALTRLESELEKYKSQLEALKNKKKSLAADIDNLELVKLRYEELKNPNSFKNRKKEDIKKSLEGRKAKIAKTRGAEFGFNTKTIVAISSLLTTLSASLGTMSHTGALGDLSFEYRGALIMASVVTNALNTLYISRDNVKKGKILDILMTCSAVGNSWMGSSWGESMMPLVGALSGLIGRAFVKTPPTKET